MKNQKLQTLKSSLEITYKRNFENSAKNIQNSSFTMLKSWLQRNAIYFKDLSNINWFYEKQVRDFYYLEGLTLSLNDNEEFGEIDNAVFEKWNKSEFAMNFLSRLNSGKSLKASSLETLKDLEKHLICLGERHILKNLNDKNSSYIYQSSLGEIQKRNHLSLLQSCNLDLDSKNLQLFYHSKSEKNQFSEKILNALTIISLYSPSSFERFLAFTDVIIPVQDESLVSYSHQELPGHSMINLYDRDFVDLMDDLLHENGHHHLNHFLNTNSLIKEPEEHNYYSPWRETLRPFRGIYHAYFTFYWALKLFYDLSQNGDLNNPFYQFKKSEISKIKWRAIEEYYMLNYSFQDLKKAKSQGLINSLGWTIVNEINKEIQKMKPIISEIELSISGQFRRIQNLKEKLHSASKLYQH